MPCLFPIDARGPCAVAIATEHIRTTVDNPGTKMAAGQEELRPLELMAQVVFKAWQDFTQRLQRLIFRFPFAGVVLVIAKLAGIRIQ